MTPEMRSDMRICIDNLPRFHARTSVMTCVPRQGVYMPLEARMVSIGDRREHRRAARMDHRGDRGRVPRPNQAHAVVRQVIRQAKNGNTTADAALRASLTSIVETIQWPD